VSSPNSTKLQIQTKSNPDSAADANSSQQQQQQQVKFHLPVAVSTSLNPSNTIQNRAGTPAAKLQTRSILDASGTIANTALNQSAISSAAYSFSGSGELWRGVPAGARVSGLRLLLEGLGSVEDVEDLAASDEVGTDEKRVFVTKLVNNQGASTTGLSVKDISTLVADLLHSSRDDIMPNPSTAGFQGQSRKILGNIEQHQKGRAGGGAGADLWRLAVGAIASFMSRGARGGDGGVKRFWAPMFVNAPPARVSEDDDVEVEEERRRMIRKVVGVLKEAVEEEKERAGEEALQEIRNKAAAEQEKEKHDRSSSSSDSSSGSGSGNAMNKSAALSNYEEFGDESEGGGGGGGGGKGDEKVEDDMKVEEEEDGDEFDF